MTIRVYPSLQQVKDFCVLTTVASSPELTRKEETMGREKLIKHEVIRE